MKKALSIIILAAAITVLLAGCKSSDYKEAVEFQDAGDYQAALDLYMGIEDYENYKDTADRVAECQGMLEAISVFESAKSGIEQKNADLDAAISEAQSLIANGDPALDDTLVPALETAISDAKAAKQNVMEMPANKDEITAAAAELNAADYSDALSNLADKKAALEKSIKQYALVNQNDVYGTTLIDKGTEAGGSIEVYSNVEDATSRRDYLAGFDGSIFASGSHTVVGTVLVRTSDKLTASQQQAMEANIIAALTEVDE